MEQVWKVTLSDIDLGDEELRAVEEVLRSKWLSMGARTAEFEEAFRSYTGARHAIAVSNGTAALHLALDAAGVGPGDEVIVPALTFVATANAVLYCGGTPVFADIVGPECLLVDPQDAARKIGPRTRAIAPVHYGGYACDLVELGRLADEHGLALIEDAAHAIGSTCGRRSIGVARDAGCFSFFSNKNLVTGEGGMVTTERDDIAEKVRLNRSHGMTALSYDKQKGHAFTYDVVSSGYNYRLTEVEAALGLVQLAKLDANNDRRRALVATYRRRLSSVEGLTVPFAGRDGESACHLMVVLLPEGVDRASVQRRMREGRVQTSVHYPPLHRFSRYRDRFAARVPRLDTISDRLLTLPLHPLMSEEDVSVVVEGLEAAIEAVGVGS